MISAHPFRLIGAVLACILILASCSSADETASTTTTVAPDSADIEESSTTDAPAATTEAPELTDEGSESTTTTIDDRTPEQIAIDELDVTSFQLGIEDLEGAANCVIERLESEGIEFTGNGTAEILALNACEPDIVTQWLPTSNPALPLDVWTCTVVEIGDWLNAGTIAEGEEFLGAESPPAEFIEVAADACGVSVEELTAAL